MSNIPDNPGDISQLVKQRIILPAAVDNIFGSYVMTPGAYNSSSHARSMSIDYDNNDNLYFAFFETTNNIMANDDINVSIKESMQTPTVLKVKYNDTQHANLFADGFQIDTMPQQLIIDYIEEN
jgi:hypothetical protein